MKIETKFTWFWVIFSFIFLSINNSAFSAEVKESTKDSEIDSLSQLYLWKMVWPRKLNSIREEFVLTHKNIVPGLYDFPKNYKDQMAFCMIFPKIEIKYVVPWILRFTAIKICFEKKLWDLKITYKIHNQEPVKDALNRILKSNKLCGVFVKEVLYIFKSP
ncbi:MAG: hypothetical protein HQM08_06895 [Candidatus Riflebacteria bacterium]|nr:hypothetical protein [Candidatus Riflebacteria bacterium]